MISIHAPRAGSDEDDANEDAPVVEFQSTLPVRGATTPDIRKAHRYDDFNPRSPCGERLWRGARSEFQSTLPVRGATRPSVVIALFSAFQSTLPVRGATKRVLLCGAPGDISIHAPRAGSQIRAIALNFNPRSPCGERPVEWLRLSWCKVFQSTLPVRGATMVWWCSTLGHGHFNPRSPCGERRG